MNDRKHKVTWNWIVDARDSKDAASTALEVLKDPESGAAVFTVEDLTTFKVETVKLDIKVENEYLDE